MSTELTYAELESLIEASKPIKKIKPVKKEKALKESDICEMIKNYFGEDYYYRLVFAKYSQGGIPDVMVIVSKEMEKEIAETKEGDIWFIEIKIDNQTATPLQKVFLRKAKNSFVIRVKPNQKKVIAESYDKYHGDKSPLIYNTIVHIGLDLFWHDCTWEVVYPD